MAGNYIPAPEGAFDAWQTSFIIFASAISFDDELTATRKAKPAGVRAVLVWVRGAWASRPRDSDSAPLDPSELTSLATDTRTPYVAAFDGADANNVARYMLRWESTRGETGRWSETASATIGA